jgi:SAM-dependent methyltransferase
MTEIGEHTRRYWKYEYDVSARYMVPLLRSWGVAVPGAELLDVGCGEGGGLCAMHDAGASCSGFDIDRFRIDAGNVLKEHREIPLTTGDLYHEPLPFAGRRFDIVVLHDVFEHLEEKARMIRLLGSWLRPGGSMLITFPPYFSAFGAHQQLCRFPFLRLPFVHLLPGVISRILPRVSGEAPEFVAEVQKLARLRMGMRMFERIATDGGLQVVHKRGYLISPNHIRFGLPPLSAGVLVRVPLLGEVLCTGVAYHLIPGT